MKTIDLPDYAKKYKTKGFDVKKVGNPKFGSLITLFAKTKKFF